MQASIITPTFNGIMFIEQCVANVVDQGNVVLEHIIVDGGSTDGTVEKVRELQRVNTKLKLIPGPDKGQSDAMNKGTAAARADIIGILNVDDFYEPGAVRRGVELLASINEPAIVVGDCVIVDQHGQTINVNRPADLRIESLLLNSARVHIPANPSAYFYHKKVHDIVGGYEVSDHYAMDLEFLLHCMAKVKARYVPEHWGNFRLLPGCKSFEDQANSPEKITKIIRRHRQYLNLWQRSRMPFIYVKKRLVHGIGRRLKLLSTRS
jgi:glycosyltransferase involved in cell wall biosynthesis